MSATTSRTKTTRQRLSRRGGELASKARSLIREGNARRVRIRHGDDEVMSFPVTVGVAGAVLAPWLAAIGAVAALVGPYDVEVRREGTEEPHGEREEAPTGAAGGAGS